MLYLFADEMGCNAIWPVELKNLNALLKSQWIRNCIVCMCPRPLVNFQMISNDLLCSMSQRVIEHLD